jgi:uncharacterized protein with HEPN domain
MAVQVEVPIRELTDCQRNGIRKLSIFGSALTARFSDVSDVAGDRVLTLALIKCIEIIGEAASRVSHETQAAHPEIPWPDIVGMRNRLIHVYFDIDLDRVHDTITSDLPPLIA